MDRNVANLASVGFSQCWIAVTFWFATCKPPRYLNPRVLSQGFLLGKDSSGFVQGLCKGGPHVLGRCQRWGSLRDPLRQHVHATSLGEFCLAILRLHPKDPCFDHVLCFCHALDSAASVLGLAGRDTAEKRFDAVDDHPGDKGCKAGILFPGHS